MDGQCLNASKRPKIEETVLQILETSDLETATESSIRTAAADRLGLDLSAVSERLFVRGLVDSFLLSMAEAILNTTPSHLFKDDDNLNRTNGVGNEKKQLGERSGGGGVGLLDDGKIICELADNRTSSINDSEGRAFISTRDFSIEDGNVLPAAEHEYQPEVDDPKRTVWSPDEDVVLAKSWATISTDSVTGNDKKDQVSWKHIADYYNKHRPAGTVSRYWKRLKSHYYRFIPLVNEFSANYNNLYTRQSGWSDENVLEKALYMWKANNNNKDFEYMHVWRVLKEYEKYAPQSLSHLSSKKSRTSETEWHTSTSDQDISVDVDDCEVRIRPIGQNAVKMKGKSKVRGRDKMDQSIDTDCQDIKEYQMQKMVLREAELLHKDYEILMKDTSEMTPEQLRIHGKIVEKIKQRYDLT